MTTSTIDADVAIAGAGPTGLLLAAELALRGVTVVVLERNVVRPDFVRAFNLGPRSLELLDRRGVVDRFLAEGRQVSATSFAGLDTPLDLTCLETDHPYVLGIPQTRTEALLEQHALETGAELRRGHEVAELSQDDEGVDIDVVVADDAPTSAGRRYCLRARCLVGCDGGRSVVRKRSGIGFPGTPATRWSLLGDVELEDPATLAYGKHDTTRGSVFVIPRPGYVRIITADPRASVDRDDPVTLEQLSDAVRLVLDREIRLTRPRWLTRFGDAARVAERFRLGRVFLAGDAAHVHPPAGAQGINVGLQDAFNLGWKLAASLHGWAPDGLLDSYHDERHAAAERVLMHTRAQTELGQTGDRIAPVRAILRSLADSAVVRRMLTELVTGFDTRYGVTSTGESASRHPLLGRLAPNATLNANGRRTSIAERMRGGQALLVVRGDVSTAAELVAARGDRLELLALDPEDGSDWLATIDAALVRPDGHVAWVSDVPERGASVAGAVRQWLG